MTVGCDGGSYSSLHLTTAVDAGFAVKLLKPTSFVKIQAPKTLSIPTLVSSFDAVDLNQTPFQKQNVKVKDLNSTKRPKSKQMTSKHQ